VYIEASRAIDEDIVKFRRKKEAVQIISPQPASKQNVREHPGLLRHRPSTLWACADYNTSQRSHSTT
jgi:hypothetical protein